MSSRSRRRSRSNISFDESTQDEEDIVSEERFKIIELRQMEIISRLTNLREMIMDIHHRYLQQNNTENGSTLAIQEFIEIVIKTDPSHPPFCLLFLYKILKEYYGQGVILQNHIHSSIQSPLQQYLTIFQQFKHQQSKHLLILITLIWRQYGNGIEVTLNPSRRHHDPIIYGEGNLCRLISRLIPPIFPLNYDTLDQKSLLQVDKLINIAEDSIAFNLDIIETYLKKHSNGPFLIGGISIADFVIFSSVSKILLQNIQSINLNHHPHLTRWIQNSQEYGQFQLFHIIQ